MSVIVIHAGGAKAGSTSVQRWLEASSATLRKHAFTAMVSRWNEAEEIVFSPHEGGEVDSGWIIKYALRKSAAAQKRLADAFVAALASSAARYGDIVISSESFSAPLGNPHSPMLASLQRLSTLHEVRVAYYARPQHTSLEASWRQWGFRSGLQPSAYLENLAPGLHYASTRRTVHSLAPGVGFEPRPFREDLLDSGDVVTDFARRFLGVEVDETGERANPSLPLELVNALRAAPEGMFWDNPHDNERLERVKQLFVDQGFPEDERIALSRQVLRKYAFDRFAAENAELGWGEFVPPPEGEREIPGLDALDRLWTPKASPVELSLLFRALRVAIQD